VVLFRPFSDALTGERQLRTTWRGHVVLQVRVRRTYYATREPDVVCGTSTYWRDACAADLILMPGLFGMPPVAPVPAPPPRP
jgi:hypothetical protein